VDPWAELQKNLAGRKRGYLETITSLDLLKGPAQARHFFKSRGPDPNTYSRLDLKIALQWLSDDHAVWTDNAALRSIRGNPLGGEDIHLVMARLFSSGPDADFPPYPAADELPGLDAPASFPVLLHTADVLSLCRNAPLDRLAIEYTIWDAIAAARNKAGKQMFPDTLIESIVDALENGPGDTTSIDELAGPWLAEFTAGGQKLGDSTASDILSGFRALLGGGLASTFIETALSDGHTTPMTTPQGLIGNEGEDFTLPDDVWAVFQTLLRLCRLPGKPLRDALADLADWLSPAIPIVQTGVTLINPPPLQLEDRSSKPPRSTKGIIEVLWSNRIAVPAGFEWPDYNREDIYWWRAVVMPVCLMHLFPLADTSDFHSLALVRFGFLTQCFNRYPAKRDPRVPQWVIDNLQLALLGFKYWFDEPATSAQDQSEMTFWSENHQIQFATSEYLAGALFPDQKFVYDPKNPMTGAQRQARGLARVRAWLDRRLRFGFSEWNAPGYYNEDLPSLFTLAEFAPDPDVQNSAAMVLDTVIFDLARLCCRGSFGVSAGRAYWEHKCYGWEQSIGDTIEVLFGTRGDIMGSSEPSAVALATSNYDVLDALLAIAIDRQAVDRQTPLVDRVRVSMFPSEATANNVNPSQGDNIVFWWGNMNYFGPETLDITDTTSGAHPTLNQTHPFDILYKFIHLNDDECIRCCTTRWRRPRA
jgi:hypothetical protein